MYVRKTVLVLLLVVALLVGGAAAMFAGRMGVNSNYTLTKEEYENWQYMQSTYGKTDMLKKMMESSYYVPVDGSKLIESSYYGLIEGLGDPYSEYVSKEEYEDYFSSMIGEYSGVGMSFYNNPDGVLEVVQVFRNSPAKEAGMQPGDIILKVDGKEYSGSQSSEAAANIRGKEGTSVEITYRRNGVENTVSIVRAPIEVETVDH
ncbi:MAG: PDZ domain-containing protein, partial [Firmicutes bacterium]|nr:PDZ domain-containing protein [Bacillota bacterium]